MDHPPKVIPLLDHFSALKDPRQLGKVVYPLPEIMLLVLCASIAAADDFVEVQHWGETHMDFLRRFLPYKDGIPSHDALNDLMNALNPKLFSECFVTWVNASSSVRKQPTSNPTRLPPFRCCWSASN
jgi:hypothetical protein